MPVSIELGVTPSVEVAVYPVIKDVREMLEYNCNDSAEALPAMSKALALLTMTTSPGA